MEAKPMRILIIEDDEKDCNDLIQCVKERNDIEIVAMTDSDIEGLKYTKLKHPDGIILDIELNNSNTGNMDSLNFMNRLKELNLHYEPVVIVTTHINSKRTYEILHRSGVDLILYKDQPKYSPNYVFNNFINLRATNGETTHITTKEKEDDEDSRISELIYRELDLIGVSNKLKGRDYIHDAILYLIKSEQNDLNVIQYLTKIYKRSATTISNGIQNAIIYAWRVSSPDELMIHYKAIVNYETGIPTPMELIYYYVDKIKKLI